MAHIRLGIFSIYWRKSSFFFFTPPTQKGFHILIQLGSACPIHDFMRFLNLANRQGFFRFAVFLNGAFFIGEKDVNYRVNTVLGKIT